MRYILKNDILNIITTKKKYIITYFLVLLIFIAFEKWYSNYTQTELLNKALGVDFSINDNLICNIIVLYTMSTFIYLSSYIFIKDLRNGVENLFLRLGIIKWIILKIVSIFIIVITIKIFEYLFLISIINFDLVKTLNIYKIFLSDIMYISTWQIIILLLYIIIKKGNYILILIPALLLYFIPSKAFLNIISLSDRLMDMSMILLLVIISLIFVFTKAYISVFEKS